MLAYAAQSYAPIYLGQLVLGLVLGVVWLRTGSITLVTAIHAIANVGYALAFVLSM
jgi:membrane protease YdiL (CAAX protease family)